jgi:hypothetical protein
MASTREGRQPEFARLVQAHHVLNTWRPGDRRSK